MSTTPLGVVPTALGPTSLHTVMSSLPPDDPAGAPRPDMQQLWRTTLALFDSLYAPMDHLRACTFTPYCSALLDSGLVQATGTHESEIMYVTQDDETIHARVVLIDEDSGLFYYQEPNCHALHSDALDRIRHLKFNVPRLLDALAQAFDIAPRFAAERPHAVLPGHLWFLGQARVLNSHSHVPVFFLRRGVNDPTRLVAGLAELTRVLSDPRFGHNGLVLTAPATRFDCLWPPRWKGDNERPPLPNGHRWRAFDELINADGVDAEIMQRVLPPFPVADRIAAAPVFDPHTGVLWLPHLDGPLSVGGHHQRAIVRVLWNAAQPLPWREIKVLAHSAARTIDDAFGGKTKRERLITKVRRGLFVIRRPDMLAKFGDGA